MQITKEYVEVTINGFFRRCEAAKNAGGIPCIDVVDKLKTVPDHWVYDHMVDYWLPPNVVLI